jgi:hypothetical protein
MRSPERRFRPLMAAFCTVLVVAGFFFPSPETYEFAAIFRRAIAVSMLWLTLLLLQRMQTEEAVRDLVDLLTGRDVTEREQARAMLQRLKSDHRTRTIPIVVLTSSREETDLLRAYETGTNSFIVKPVDFDSFMEAVRQLGLYWLLVNQFPAGNGVPSGS